MNPDDPIAIAARLTATPHCQACRDMREQAAAALIALAAPAAEPVAQQPPPLVWRNPAPNAAAPAFTGEMRTFTLPAAQQPEAPTQAKENLG